MSDTPQSNWFSEESPTSLKLCFQGYFGKRKTLTEAFHENTLQMGALIGKNVLLTFGYRYGLASASCKFSSRSEYIEGGVLSYAVSPLSPFI